MEKPSLFDQVHSNAIAIISLIVAIISLFYVAWREDVSEKNRNIRLAAFEVLKNLGELQVIVNYAQYESDSAMGDPMIGWGHIALISDLSKLLPEPVPATVDQLLDVWKADWKTVKTEEKSADAITEKIDASRAMVLQKLSHLG